MNKQHITYFKVENFKKFDSLELTDIGQFNLIVGDNNIGKTSVLEALLFDRKGIEAIGNLHQTLCSRNYHIHPKLIFNDKREVQEVEFPPFSYLSLIIKDLSMPLKYFYKTSNSPIQHLITLEQVQWEELSRAEQKEISGTFPKTSKYFIRFQVGRKKQIFWLHSEDLREKHNRYIPFLPVNLGFYTELPQFFQDAVGNSTHAYEEFIENMRFLIPDIESIQVRPIWGGKNFLMIGQKNIDEMTPLTRFGDSVVRLTLILIEILKAKGGRLMIDEIDTGIHHSRMKNFLKTIFQVALKNDVQIFMTTHSLECQRAFADIFEDPELVTRQELARQFSLIKTPKGQIVANPFKFEQLQYALEIGFDTRGGRREW